MAKRKRTRFPSQIKYEKENPSVAVRLKRDEYNELREHVENMGKSMSQFIREAIFPHLTKERSSWEDGRDVGWEHACLEFQINYPCNACGKACIVRPGSGEHKAIIELLSRQGWGHEACHRPG